MSKIRIVDEDTHRQAEAALKRAAERKGLIFMQPSRGLTEWDGADTLVMHNSHGEVGRVRVASDGRMRAV